MGGPQGPPLLKVQKKPMSNRVKRRKHQNTQERCGIVLYTDPVKIVT